jgi:uncharacterized paraquat-inducible protein A
MAKKKVEKKKRVVHRKKNCTICCLHVDIRTLRYGGDVFCARCKQRWITVEDHVTAMGELRQECIDTYCRRNR